MAASEALLAPGGKDRRKVQMWNLVYVSGALALFFAQLLTGTGLAYAALVLLFILLTGLTMRVLGGVWNLFGLSVGVLALQHVVIATVAKVVFLQPADAPLLHPLDTMLMYCLGMSGIFCAALAYRSLGLDSARQLFRPETDSRRLFLLSLVFTLLSIVRFWLLARFGVFEGAGGGVYIGGWVGPLRQFTFIPVLAVAYGTASVIISSKGRRCVGPINFFAIVAPILAGILGAMRADTGNAFITFALTCIAFGFKFRIQHYAVAAVAIYFFQFVMFPYALYARGEGEVRIGNFEERITKAFATIGDVMVNPGKYKELAEEVKPQEPYEFTRMRYFGRRLPTLDRYSMVIVNDQVIEATYLEGTTGWKTTEAGVDMILPRVLNPNKEAFGTSNWIARRAKGLVNETDTYTQITLGFFCDAFMSFKWAGVFGFAFALPFLYFLVFGLVFGSRMQNNVYATSLAFISTWIFSEGTIQAQMLNIVLYPAYFIAVVLPFVVLAASLSKRSRAAKAVYERSEPRAARP